MTVDTATTIYFSGIGGIGMSGLAQLLSQDNKKVLGSDISQSQVTQQLAKRGIRIFNTQDGSGITADVDLVVFTDAVPEDHPERKRAQEFNITQLSYFQALGEYMKQFKTAIAVCGTHGKSTTTALIGNILVEAKLDPTVIVGSIVKEWGSNARMGSSDKELLLVEACEHQAHMLNLYPTHIVLTNIEEDHLDYYHDIDHIVATFQKFINHLPASGVLIKNSDDKASEEIGFDGKVITYGHADSADTEDADVRAEHIEIADSTQTIMVGTEQYQLRIPGKFNVSNVLAAITLGKELHISEHVMQKVIQQFKGVWRRFEILGTYKGATIISDYAHHPTAIASTITAAHEFYPDKRIFVVFQPHQRSRTQKLFKQFVTAFEHADFMIIQEIYDVAGREGGKDEQVEISSQHIVDEIEKTGKYALYSHNADETRQKIDDFIEKDDVLLIMGAGDIYRLAEELAQ